MKTRRSKIVVASVALLSLLLILLILAIRQGRIKRSLAETERRQADQLRWRSELYVPQFEPMLAAFLDDSTAPWNFFDEDFRGAAPSAGISVSRIQEGGLSVDRTSFGAVASVPASRFMEQISEYMSGFDRVDRIESHVSRVALLPHREGQPVSVEIEFDTLIAGQAQGRRRSDKSDWSATLTSTEPGLWKFRRLAARELEVARSRPVFTDVTSQLPASHRSSHPDVNELNLGSFWTDLSAALPATNGVSLADWDRDGDLDIYLFRPHLSPLFYENDGRGRFRDVSSRMNPQLGDVSEERSGAGYFFDADGDGALDFLNLQRGHAPRLFRGNAGHFEEVRDAFVDLPDSSWISAAIADYDRDQNLDLYLTRYGGFPMGHFLDATGPPNFLLRNRGDGTFVDVTEESGMALGNDRPSFAAAWADYNNDGHLDLYVANDSAPNKLYTNRGDGTFSEDAQRLDVEDRGNGMGVSWADYDNDGHLDLYISNMDSYAGERITHNLGDGLDQEGIRRVQRFAKGNTLYRNRGDGSFTEVTPNVAVARALVAWGAAFFDYDRDGDLDVYVANGFFSNVEEEDT